MLRRRSGIRHGTIWRSYTFQDPYDYRYPEGGEEWEPACNGFTVVRVYAEARAIITYCEGDLNLEVYPTEDGFAAAVASMQAFYARMNH